MARHALCAVLVIVFAAAPAWSDLALVVVRGDSAERQDITRMAVEHVLRDRGLTISSFHDAVVERGLNPADVEGCAEAGQECMRAAVELAQADRVILISLREVDLAKPENIAVIGWIIDGRSGVLLYREQRICQRCTTNALAEMSSRIVAALAAKDSAKRALARWIKVQSVPVDAQVSIDGSPVGKSGLLHKVGSGEHVVVIESEGYYPIRRKVVLAANETKILQVQLVERSATQWSTVRTWLKWGGLVGGAGILALGIVWVAVDGPQIKNGVRQPNERNTLVPGLVSSAIGVGLLGVSAALFLIEPADRNAPALGGVFVPVQGGAIIGAVGRF